MNHLKPLIMMQLKDKLDFSFLSSRKKTITKVVFTILAFVAVTALCFVFFMLSSMLNLFSLVNVIPTSLMVFIFTIMFLLSCIACTFGLMKKLYFSPDNQVLLTFPVKPNMVFVSKLIVFYIYELIKNLYFMIPVFIAYGIYAGYSLIFYPWMILCFLFISALPVLIGAILSIPLMYISTWLKKIPYLKAALFVIVLGAVIFGVVKLITIIPENINLIQQWRYIFWWIQDFLAVFVKIFAPFTYLVQLLCGTIVNLKYILFSVETIYILLSLIAITGILFAISFYLARPLFFKMASKPFEYKKRLIKKVYNNNFRKPVYSGIRTHIKSAFRTPDFLYNYLGILIVLPIAILLLNKIFNAMNTRLSGVYMTMSFNILLMLLVLLASNVIIASLYSKEGRSSYYFKTMPKPHIKVLLPKLIFSLAISFVSVLITVIIFGVFAKLSFINIIFCILFIYGIYVGHLFWSAELDLMNPKNEQYATSGTQESNSNETKSTIFAFIISAIAFVFSLMLLNEDFSLAWVKLMFIGVVFAAVRIYLYINRIKVYYKEK